MDVPALFSLEKLWMSPLSRSLAAALLFRKSCGCPRSLSGKVVDVSALWLSCSGKVVDVPALCARSLRSLDVPALSLRSLRSLLAYACEQSVFAAASRRRSI